MKILLPLFILIFVFSTFAQNAITITPKAFLRKQPSKTAKIVYTFKKDTKLWLSPAGSTNGWYYVAAADFVKGKPEGWIYGNDIKLSTPKVEVDKSVQKQKNGETKNELNETLDQFQTRLLKAVSYDWYLYGIDISDCYHFYNKNRISTFSGGKIIWTRTACFRSSDVMKNIPEINASLVKAGVFYILYKLKIDCTNEKFGMYLSEDYSQKEERIGWSNETTNPEMMSIAPETVTEKLLFKICENK